VNVHPLSPPSHIKLQWKLQLRGQIHSTYFISIPMYSVGQIVFLHINFAVLGHIVHSIIVMDVADYTGGSAILWRFLCHRCHSCIGGCCCCDYGICCCRRICLCCCWINYCCYILQNWVENLSPAMGRGIDSRNRVWNWVAKIHRLAGRYGNTMPTWFLAPIAGLKLPTLGLVRLILNSQTFFKLYCFTWLSLI
jgi:hypothetical protein